MSGHRSARSLYSAPEIPQNHGAAPGSAPDSARGRDGRIPGRHISHRAHDVLRLLRCLDVIDEDAHQAKVESVLDDPLGLFARIGRESREHGRMCLRVAPLENAGLVRHAGQKDLQLIETHGAVFHVEVDEVDVGVARQ